MAASPSRVHSALIACALIICSATDAHAVWGPYGTTLTQDYVYHGTGGARVFPRPDGSILVGYQFWVGTYPDFSSNWALVSASGDLLGTGGAGGSALSWDYGDAIYSFEAYPDYITNEGHVWVGRTPAPAGWPSPVWKSLASYGQDHFYALHSSTASDSGVFAVWTTLIGGTLSRAIRAGRMNPDGTVDSAWTGTGKSIETATTAYDLDPAAILADDSRGAYVAWYGQSDQMRVIRLTANAQVSPGWPTVGMPGGTARQPDDNMPPGMLLLPDGDLVVAWKDQVNTASGAFRIARWHPNGTRVNGWPVNGNILRPAMDSSESPVLVSDGVNGVYLVWARPLASGAADLLATRVLDDGTVPPAWNVTGLPLLPPDNAYHAAQDAQYGSGWNFRTCPDGAGGLFAAWDDVRYTNPSIWLVQRGGDGSPGLGWASARLISDPSRLASCGSLATGPAGSVFIGWDTTMQPPVLFPPNHVAMLSRILPDIPVAVQLSLVRADASPSAVRLEWFVAGGAGATGTVYRRTQESSWSAIASVAADPRGGIVCSDTDVRSSTRYGYRLGIGTGTSEIFSSDAWVDVPAAALALRAMSNPCTRGDVAMILELPAATSGRLELIDLAGRVRDSQDVGALGAGSHTVHFSPRAGLEPGAYVVRLSGTGTSLIRRVVVLR